ncbi:MAG: biopolymer transporter ExbD [Hyphomicrobiales bacterium]|nr:biopolymer transporter ExbD [Hyphomicrobiales bacterium]
MRRPTPAYAAAVQEGRPISELNMTPLIDVLLVLIVMFILLVPAAVTELEVNLPAHAPVSGPPPVTYRVTVARDGAVALDGVGVSDAALAARLAAIGPDAAVVLGADPQVRYARAAAVLGVVRGAGVTRLGFEGLGVGAP